MRETFLIFGAPDITDSDLEAVIDTFRSGWIGTGPQAAELETRFAAYTGSPHGVALSSCTAALHLAMLASGIQPGEEVITTPMTFCATANAILHAGAIPVFADIHPRTGLIDPAEIERRITPNTRAIVPVHLHGRPCDMDAISRIARENNLLVIEDCAHAIETLYHGRHAGTFGDAGCFSFYVTKNIVGIDGGMVVTASRPLAEQVKILALHGMTSDAWKRFSDEGYKHYEVVSLGYKYNLPDVHAACALSQLGRVETNLSHRERLWDYYNKAFAGSPCFLPEPATPHTRHARHLYTLLL
ncbi:UDP-4-amino-4,6-dideoxy-N-acetyl-beta-L-altrosamine transaminase, partial [bacterium]|nr:UDP-4-amino-4,6-dideoxy-N-acetyl-beta-L-altrosamine transaminase [bacterium]